MPFSAKFEISGKINLVYTNRTTEGIMLSGSILEVQHGTGRFYYR